MITTKQQFIKNRYNKNIYTLYSESSIDTGNANKNRPVVIMPCAYEKTVIDYIFPALYLLTNGFDVVRYDNPNHLGASDGDIYDFDLVEIYETLQDVIHHVSTVIKKENISILATSLMARCTVKALSEYDHLKKTVRLLVNMVGVVNLRDTISKVCELDVFSDEHFDLKEFKVLNHYVNRKFVDRAKDIGLHTYESITNEISKVDIPIYNIAASNDHWVDLQEIINTYKDNVIILPGGIHEVSKNPNAAKVMLKKVTEIFMQNHNGNATVREPDFNALIKFTQQERELERMLEN